MPEVSGARSADRESKCARRFCECSCIEFPWPLPHLLRRTIAHPPRDKSKEHPMDTPKYKNALIVGTGAGLSASLARLFARERIRVALAARSIEKLGALCAETKARAYACDATNADEVERLFGLVEREIGTPDLVVYNASA